MRRPILALLPLCFALQSCAHSPRAATVAPGPGTIAWERLKATLPGSWTLPAKNGAFLVSYKLVSGGSALVEEWGAGTPFETETVFYPNHADLLLTHYCAQGNQPRLRVSEVSSDALVFRFVDVTNEAPDQSMLVERTLRFAGDSFDDTEVYRGPDGKDDKTTYHFRRSAKPAADVPQRPSDK